MPYLDLQDYHEKQQALRRLLRGMRKELQRTDQYDASKLQLLDNFHV